MVKKLFKYEFLAYIRVLFPVYIAMLGVAVLGRILMIFESDTISSDLLIGGSIFMYVITVFVAFGFVSVYAVVRFYKNMFTGEGYLTLTLPATADEHILAKLLSAILFNFVSVIVFIVSFAIFAAGDVFKEVAEAASYLIKKAEWYYLLEFVLSAIVGMVSNILLYYACLSIGQLFKKNRIAGAVGAYFAYNLALQILSTIALAALAESDYIGDVVEFVLQRNYILSGVMAIVFYFITRHIVTNKLNLE